MRDLKRAAAPAIEPEPVQLAETEADQKAAAEFFRAQGIKIIKESDQ